jgi:hypothetical protein
VRVKIQVVLTGLVLAAAITSAVLSLHTGWESATRPPSAARVPDVSKADGEVVARLSRRDGKSTGQAVAAPDENAADRREHLDSSDEVYRKSEDYFSFVQAIAPAAISGDGRAQWLLSRALFSCELHMRTRQDVVEHDPNAMATLRFRRCERFAEGHPLDAFELPAEAKSYSYWSEQALISRDPIATVARAVANAVRVGSDASANKDLRAAIRDDIRVVVASRDAEAILGIAGVYMQPEVARNQSQGPAWAYAACELGYDCSQPFPAVREDCASTGICSAITSVRDVIQAAGNFDKVYSQGLAIADQVRLGDWEGLQPYLEMKP